MTESQLLRFMQWYQQGMPYHDFMYNLRNTVNPWAEALGRENEPFNESPLSSLVSYSDEWAKDYGMPLWQFWFDEYIAGLALYIIKEYDNPRVLEVGAGDGWLSKLLLEKGVNVIATTDNHSWSVVHKIKHAMPVEELSYYKAVQKYRPDLVLVSWMPYTEDWTKAFRYFTSTKGYIMIGEGKHGCCGRVECFNPPEGWRVHDGYEFDKFNLCRTDYISPIYGDWVRHSCTTDIRRVV